MPKRPLELRIFTRRLRRLSAVTLIVALILPMRFDFSYALAAQVLLVLWLASYEITYRREHRRAMEKEERTYLTWRLAGSFGFLLLVIGPPIIAAIAGIPTESFFPYYFAGMIGFWMGIIVGEYHWRWKYLERISGEERGRYWRRYNDALFYSIPF